MCRTDQLFLHINVQQTQLKEHLSGRRVDLLDHSPANLARLKELCDDFTENERSTVMPDTRISGLLWASVEAFQQDPLSYELVTDQPADKVRGWTTARIDWISAAGEVLLRNEPAWYRFRYRSFYNPPPPHPDTQTVQEICLRAMTASRPAIYPPRGQPAIRAHLQQIWESRNDLRAHHFTGEDPLFHTLAHEGITRNLPISLVNQGFASDSFVKGPWSVFRGSSRLPVYTFPLMENDLKRPPNLLAVLAKDQSEDVIGTAFAKWYRDSRMLLISDEIVPALPQDGDTYLCRGQQMKVQPHILCHALTVYLSDRPQQDDVAMRKVGSAKTNNRFTLDHAGQIIPLWMPHTETCTHHSRYYCTSYIRELCPQVLAIRSLPGKIGLSNKLEKMLGLNHHMRFPYPSMPMVEWAVPEMSHMYFLGVTLQAVSWMMAWMQAEYDPDMVRKYNWYVLQTNDLVFGGS